MTDIDDAKAALRAHLRRERAAIDPEHRATAGLEAARHLQTLIDEHTTRTPAAISLFLAIGSEIDTMPAIRRLRDAGHTILLPRQKGRARPLDFHRWTEGDPLEEGPFGVREPLVSVGSARPAILVVPLLAIDRSGNRLGYGGGFYDRTLTALEAAGDRPISTIGYGFECQLIEHVPTQENDRRLDHFVHPGGIVTFGAWGPGERGGP